METSLAALTRKTKGTWSYVISECGETQIRTLSLEDFLFQALISKDLRRYKTLVVEDIKVYHYDSPTNSTTFSIGERKPCFSLPVETLRNGGYRANITLLKELCLN